MAQAVVQGADGVSITLPRNGRFGTVAASNDVVLEMDHDQYDTGEGPCLDAAIQGERFHIHALGEEQRWPAFVPRARARGIESILSTPLVASERPIGALNVYSRMVGAFAVHEKEWADQFAAEAATVVSTARLDESVHGLSSQIRAALQSREVIALAQGMIMQRDGVDPTVAHATLIETSRSTGRRLRDVSEDLVRANSDATTTGVHATAGVPSDGSAHVPATQ
jgi:GAF domain-containing protein